MLFIDYKLKCVKRSLNIVKETSSEYHCTCPVCGDGGFKVNKSNGKYQAFKCGCDLKDIRESIRPWSEVTENQPHPKVKPNPKNPFSRAYRAEKGTESKISLARLPCLYQFTKCLLCIQHQQ